MQDYREPHARWLNSARPYARLPPYVSGDVSDHVRQQSEARMGQYPQSFRKTLKVSVSSKYLLHLPDRYDSSKNKWPLILFLHGAGERGDDLSKVAVHGPPKLVGKAGQELPFVIVSPQCPVDDWWPSALQIAALGALLDDIVSRYRIDKDRIYVTGLSMGGYGTWSLAVAHPNRFAAIAPICGGGNPKAVASIAHLPVWVFHGAKDEAVPLAKSKEMVKALRRAGGKPKFTIYPNAGHDSWTAAYGKPGLYEWFLQHSRSAGKPRR